jgi:hypothetical protein
MQRDDAAARANRKLLKDVVSSWQKLYGQAVNAAALVSGVASSQHDLIESIPLAAVIEDFLLKVQIRDPRDAEEHSAMLVALAAVMARNSELKADVVLMNRLEIGYRTRVDGRGVSANHAYAPINQYFSQSAGTKNDRDYCSVGQITLQLRRFDLGTHQRDRDAADIKDVAWFALNVPRKLRKELVIEERS